MSLKIVGVLFFLIFSQVFKGQVHEFKFETLSIEEGLNHNSVNCFLHDSNGFLWIGTFEGINMYDGYSMYSFHSDLNDSTSLSNNFIECIFEDACGNIWIGTQNGLNRYVSEVQGFIHYFPDSDDIGSITHNVIKTINQDLAGNLWIGTYGGGLSKYDYQRDSFISYNENNSSIPSNFINDIFEDYDGKLWLGTWLQGLVRFSPEDNSFQQFLNDSNEKNFVGINTINTIIEKRRNILWLGTWGKGITTFNTETNQFGTLSFDKASSQKIQNTIVKSLLQISNYEVLAGSFGDGLFQIKTGDSEDNEVTQYTYDVFDDYSISGNSIWSLYRDRSGICWIATWGDGVNKIDFDKNRFQTFHPALHKNNWLKHYYISASVEVLPNVLLIGTIDGGFYKFNKTTNVFINLDSQNLINKARGITTFAREGTSRVWVGTRSGLFQYDILQEKLLKFETDSKGRSLSGDEVSAIHIDHQNNVWVGIRGAGIDKLVPNSSQYIIKRYWDDPENPASLSSNTITSVFRDYSNNIWISTLNGGINIYDAEKDSFKLVTLKDESSGISTDNILTVYETKGGDFWIGTLSQGLWHFNRHNGKFKSFTKEDGLSNNSVYAILEDSENNLWVSTGYGISRFNPVSATFTNYFKKDGLHGNNFNFDIYSGVCKMSNQAMFFGGKSGFTIFSLNQIKENTYVPQVVINRLMVNGDYVNVNDTVNNRVLLDAPLYELDEITLTRHEQLVSFEFASLHFATPENNEYEYILEGFDKDWIQTGAQRRFATYTNLPSGSYMLKVRASNSHGKWHPDSLATLKIIVKPPIWKTPWFIILMLIPFFIIGFYIYKSRIRYVQLEMSVKDKLHEAEQIIREKQLLKLEQERLSHELDEKNKVLATNVMFMDQKNQRLKNVKDYLTEITPNVSDQNRKQLNKLKNMMEEDASGMDDWDSFEKSFDVLHDDFMKSFANTFPKVTHKDLRLVSYIRMNYSNKEIAEMLNISLRSIESSRYRLRKKMELSSAINLNDFIIRF
jgi:ligand-binding sensor domain-containing protein